MNVRFLCAAAMSLCTAATAAQISSPTLRCTIPTTRPGDLGNLVRSATPPEIGRMRHAPHGATRVGHRLEVRWSHGVRWFHDKPPYDGSLDGLHWAYCGFSSAFDVHLIGKQDGGLFTGVLLNDRTGALLPAGEEVRFSPNRLSYLASEQPDGQDGPTLKVYRSDGRLIWKGYGGILAPNGATTFADFVNVGWNSNDQVTMKVKLPNGAQRTATLAKVGDSWQWLPKLDP